MWFLEKHPRKMFALIVSKHFFKHSIIPPAKFDVFPPARILRALSSASDLFSRAALFSAKKYVASVMTILCVAVVF